MGDGKWNDESGVDNEKAKRLQAGVNKPSAIVEGIKSAWLGLKTGLGLDEKKKPDSQDEEYR